MPQATEGQHNAVGRKAPLPLASVLLLLVRVLAIAAALVWGLIHPFVPNIDSALQAALLSLTAMMAVQLLVDLQWQRLVMSEGVDATSDPTGAWGSFVGLIVTTAGVVLGLLQSFKSAHLSQTLRVGTLSLAITVLLGIVVFGLGMSAPRAANALVFRAFLMNVTLWALGLGLLTIAWSLVLQ